MTAILDTWIHQHQQKDLLRFLTCGSVDDGKSTLIGRLLYDTDLVPDDQLAAVAKDSEKHGTTGKGVIDLALLTDGLKAEREQGITIDVAYRYFSTEKRKFIIADCPGHQQYTRNMATGASNCQLAIILVDARYGVQEQTRRHAFIVSLLGIRHIVVAVNKMDLVGWSEATFARIQAEFAAFAARLDLPDIHFVPVSALNGDNVASRGEASPWYQGPTLLEHLETVSIAKDRNLVDFRFPVQLALRPNLDFRGFAGSVASGVVQVGDDIVSLPSGRRSRVKSILVNGEAATSACAPEAAVITLFDEIDCSRGDMLAHPGNLPTPCTGADAMLVWMHERPLEPGRRYLVRHASGYTPGTVAAVIASVDVNTLAESTGTPVGLNGIARVRLEFTRPLLLDAYARNRITGSLVLVDRDDNATVAAGMILPFATVAGGAAADLPAERRRILGHGPAAIRSSDPTATERALLALGIVPALVTDGALATALLAQGQVVVVPTTATLTGITALDASGDLASSLRQAGVLSR